MKRLGVFLFSILVAFNVWGQNEESSIKQSKKTDKQNIEISTTEQEAEATPPKKNIWELDLKGTQIKGKRIRKFQMGTDAQLGERWDVSGKVVDTLGNPIEGVEVMFWISPYEISPKLKYDNVFGNPITDKDGSYTLRSIFPVEYRVFYKKGYRVAGERRPKTKLFAFHYYTRPNLIVMVPVDYTGDESKYKVGILCGNTPRYDDKYHTFNNDLREYYEFESISFFHYLKQINVLNTTDTSVFVSHAVDNYRMDSEYDKYIQAKEKHQERKRMKKEQRTNKKSKPKTEPEPEQEK